MAGKGVERRKKPRESEAIVFTARERAVIDEVKKNLIEELMDRFSVYFAEEHKKAGIVDAAQHADDHMWWRKVRPWVEAQAVAAAKRAEFWTKAEAIASHVLDKVLKDSLILLLKVVLVGGLLVFTLGRSGALKFIGDHAAALLGLS